MKCTLLIPCLISLAMASVQPEEEVAKDDLEPTVSSEDVASSEPTVASLRNKCKEADKLFRRRSCFEHGHIVTFVMGDYYCCPKSITDSELMAIGTSAFWRRGRGFCGRGACEKCDKKSQECVVFGDEDVFCCPLGYQPSR